MEYLLLAQCYPLLVVYNFICFCVFFRDTESSKAQMIEGGEREEKY